MCLFCTMQSVTKEFRTYGQKWGDNERPGTPGGLLSYSFATENISGQFGTFDEFIIDPAFQSEITESLLAWENVADIRFTLVPDDANVDLRFGWRDIDGKNGVLGQTTVPSFGPLDSVVIALDNSEDWFLSGDATGNLIDFSSTVTHEIGHAIGIDHSESKQALMNAIYSSSIFEIQQDDIDAAINIYGANDIIRIDVNRFFNLNTGGHFFTADQNETRTVEQNSSFTGEGIGFNAMSADVAGIDGSVSVFRFFNTKSGGHFFTAFEEEKDSVLLLEDFVFEGVGFKAFSIDSVSTVPIFRFFNMKSGGHFFTANEREKEFIENAIPEFRYEGEAFYAFV